MATREDTYRMVKFLDSTYAKSYLEQVSDNLVQMNADKRIKLLSLLNEFDDFFDGNIREWDTEPVDLELNINSKPVNSKYYLLPDKNPGYEVILGCSAHIWSSLLQ